MYTVVCTNIGGLANRMRCIASIHKYSVDKPLECRVKWEVLDDYKKHTHILNCPFSKLFSNDIELKKTPEKKYYLYNSHCLLVENKDGIPDGFNTFESKCAKQFTKSDKRGRNIDFMYHKIPNELRERYINAFKILEPIPELQTKIQDFSDSHFESDTVSVHIRSWNRNGETGRRGYLYSIEKFEVEMRKREPHVKFFIATDSQYVREFFNSSIEWKERVIFYDRKTDLDTSRDFPQGVQEDLIELYLLSKNKELIGSHFSTYSEVAWWLGGCGPVVII